MEVAIGNAPFRREVREWQRVDPNTGALLSGRLEADRWINGPLNTYGKVVDSKNVSTPNGTQLSQRKQLEILQAHTSSGSLQVVRAHTVQTSSSRWSSSHKQLNSNCNDIKSIEHFSTTNTQTNGDIHAAASIPHNSYKSVFQRKQLAEPQTKFKHISLPTEISTNINVGVSLTQLDLRNERETFVNSHSLLNRGKSVSNEDLTAERDEENFDDDVEPIEWRRVSKIRRSLQLPKSSFPRNNYIRPPDLPENSVSVSKIREELENGRRLSTAMRNNHVDLVALDNILNGVSEKGTKSDLKIAKKATFITAESLQEIRGKLKRLSDESLYKTDMSQHDEDIINNLTRMEDNINTDENISGLNFSQQSDHNSIIRDTRSRVKDTSSSEWYSRRKSYGFEKMAPSPDSSSKMLESTDSGIGRSSEINNLWSPTESSPKSTILQFSLGENNLKHNNSSTYITLMNGTHDIKQTQFSPYKQTDDETKRHSIAVDEAKYVRDNLRRVFETKTSVHLNGLYSDDSSQNNSDDKDGRRLKRVEFCKTEVHFAAESGRVNIVETDGKPPPTNNFRRRRRVNSSSSNIGSSFLEAINSGIPVTHFGDTEKKTKEEPLQATNVTTSVVKTSNIFSEVLTSKKEEDDQLDETSIRGILKNKPIKPKPYHLGDNIDSSQSLWGVRLKPISNDFKNWRSGIDDDNDANSDTESNFADLKSTSVDDEERYKNKIVEQDFSTSKLSLLSNSSNFSWHNKDQDSEKTTRISIDMSQNECWPEINNKSVAVNNNLKSTSLIMKTMRSANQFDEAMKRLSTIASTESDVKDNSSQLIQNVTHHNGPSSTSALKLISQMKAITKSNSANNIFKETAKLSLSRNVSRKYSSSLDGDYILSNRDYDSDDIGGMNHNGHQRNLLNNIAEQKLSLQKNTSSSSFSTSSSTSFNYEKSTLEKEIYNHKTTDVTDGQKLSRMDNRKPVAAPRMKKIGPTNVLSQQLSQLRRLYEAADQDSDDSAQADEEVKHYLGNLVPFEEKTSELSGSWSRVKAKRTVLKNYKDEDKTLNIPENGEYKFTSGKADVVHSNVLSIALHSPTTCMSKNYSTKTPPVAKPRTVTPAEIVRSNETTPKFNRKIYTSEIKDEQIKIDSSKLASGTRKLREHELSYFGISLPKSPTDKKNPISPNNRVDPSVSPTKLDQLLTKMSKRNKWQLSNDKPDLLRHSPNVEKLTEYGQIKTVLQSNQSNGSSITTEEPVYENLRKPSSSYNRKHDLKRDEMILTELSNAADQILSTVVTTKIDDEKKMSSPKMRLQTIEENKSIQKKMQSKGVQVSRGYSDPLRRHRSSRVSSESSNEGATKGTQINQKTTGHSTKRLCNKSHESGSRSESITSSSKSTRKRYTTSGGSHNYRMHRTSSRDTLNSQASSSEDLPNSIDVVSRRPRRVRPKEKVENVQTPMIESHRTSRTENTQRNSSTRTGTDRSSSKKSHRSDNSTHTSKGATEQQAKTRVKSGVITTTSSSRRSSRHPEGIWK